MSAPDYPSTSGFTGSNPEQGNEDSTNLTKKAQSDLADIGEEMKHQAANLGEEAKAQVSELADKAKGMATEQKDLLASQLGGISDALQKVASELEESDEGSASYVRAIASGAERVTSTVRDRDVDEIISMAQDFGRRQPAAFIGAAALLGFAASRFIMASANRASNQQPSMRDDGADSTFDSGIASTGSSTRSSYSQTTGGTDGGI